MRDIPKFWSDDAIRKIRNCGSSQLRDMAVAIGQSPQTFFRRANFEGTDLRGQDLRGMDLAQARFEGAIIDATTLLDDGLTGLFGSPSTLEILTAFDATNLPVFGRREIVLRLIEDILEGVRVCSLLGAAGAGKTAILDEIRSILLSRESHNFDVPAEHHDLLAEAPTFVIAITPRSGTLSDLLLRALASGQVRGESRKRLSSVLEDDLFLRSFNMQPDFIEYEKNIFTQLRTSASSLRKNEFLVQFFNHVQYRYPGSRFVVLVDETERFSQIRELILLLRDAPYIQVILSGRRSDNIQYIMDIDDRARISHNVHEIDSLPPDTLSHVFDWLQSRLGGSIHFPGHERTGTLRLVRGNPEVLVSALKLGIAFAIKNGLRLPLEYSTSMFIGAVRDFTKPLELKRLNRFSPKLFDGGMAYMLAALDARLSNRNGVSAGELARSLEISPRESQMLIERLVRTGSAREYGGRAFMEGGLAASLLPRGVRVVMSPEALSAREVR